VGVGVGVGVGEARAGGAGGGDGEVEDVGEGVGEDEGVGENEGVGEDEGDGDGDGAVGEIRGDVMVRVSGCRGDGRWTVVEWGVMWCGGMVERWSRERESKKGMNDGLTGLV
jgi:hypothetical protein